MKSVTQKDRGGSRSEIVCVGMDGRAVVKEPMVILERSAVEESRESNRVLVCEAGMEP